jgi:hypothetical protein
VGSLRCDVSVLSFSDLFVHLFASGKSGVLTVFQGTMKKSFYVNSDGVSLLATTGQARSLGEMLIRTRKVTRAQLDRLLDEKAISGRRLAELVQRYGLVTAEDVEMAKRDHVEEELHELFGLKNAVCEFVEGPPPRMIENFYAGVVVGKAATALMLESARRSDELAKIMSDLGDESLVPVRSKTWEGGPLEDVPTDQLYAVYRSINGTSNLADVARHSLYPRLEALRALHAFLVHKVIVLMNPNEVTQASLTETEKAVDEAALAESPAAAVLAGAPARPKGKPKTILLLGEMLLYKTPLTRLLTEAGYKVKAPSIESLLETLNGDRVSVAMVDVSGRSLKNYPLAEVPWEAPGSRIVAIARDASLAAKRKAFEQGANVYAVMPFTKKNILGILDTVLSPTDDLHLPFFSSDIS